MTMTLATRQADLPDFSDMAAGPALIALRSEDKADSQFRLGTREYDWHRHIRGQLFCVENGLVQVRTTHGAWLLPPHRAGWIPPGQMHKVTITGAMHGWSVLLNAESSTALPERPWVIAINELMTALVRRAASWDMHAQLNAQLNLEQENIIQVLLDELRQAPHQPLHLPMPAHHRLLPVTAAILSNPGARHGLKDLAELACMSARTLSRLFQAETGISIGQWSQQAGLLHALELLAQGESVAAVADALGYATPSNFIVMFRRYFGESPGRYFSI
ncbi:AraC family transcriptional regulator [Undibacterium sp. TJN19]|uniref:AraC family transcriptional regulator n=1 Tax=Undibacterium sp. TJN19 TaxID=3413055 RepID=UPI003BEF7848